MIELDQALVAQTSVPPARIDGLSLGEKIAINLFWRKKVRVLILAKVFQCSKNTIYYNCLTGDAASYPPSNSARQVNAIIDQIGEKKAWSQYVTPGMIHAVNSANEELAARLHAA